MKNSTLWLKAAWNVISGWLAVVLSVVTMACIVVVGCNLAGAMVNYLNCPSRSSCSFVWFSWANIGFGIFPFTAFLLLAVGLVITIGSGLDQIKNEYHHLKERNGV